MAFDSYTQITVGANEVRELIGSTGARLDRALAEISGVVSQMASIGAQYGPIVAAADAMVAADPNNPAKAAVQADITQLLADFNALQSRAATLDALINSAP